MVKKKFQAAAISYDPAENDAPVLSAFGEGHLAERIVEVANVSGVPVVSEPNLAEVLSKLSVGDEISPEMYDVVAKVLAFVSEMDRSYGEKVRAGLDKRLSNT